MAVRFPGCAARASEFCWIVVERSLRRGGYIGGSASSSRHPSFGKSRVRKQGVAQWATQKKNGASVPAWLMVSSAQVRNTLWHYCPRGHMIYRGGFVASAHASWQHLSVACDDMLST